jgi:hypothetical protein
MTRDLANGELLVANNLPSPAVMAYVRTANGNVAPLRTLVGPATGLVTPMDLAIGVAAPPPLLAPVLAIPALDPLILIALMLFLCTVGVSALAEMRT